MNNISPEHEALLDQRYKEQLISERQARLRLDILYKKCRNCGGNIVTMCFIGTGVCSENCRKDVDRQTELVKARNIYSGVTVSKEEVAGWKP